MEVPSYALKYVPKLLWQLEGLRPMLFDMRAGLACLGIHRPKAQKTRRCLDYLLCRGGQKDFKNSPRGYIVILVRSLTCNHNVFFQQYSHPPLCRT